MKNSKQKQNPNLFLYHPALPILETRKKQGELKYQVEIEENSSKLQITKTESNNNNNEFKIIKKG